MLQLTVWSLPSLAALSLSTLAFSRVRWAGAIPGRVPLGVLCGCVALWAAGQFVGTLCTNIGWKILASKAQYPGIALLPPAWFVFALCYVRRISTLRPRSLVLLLALPVVTVVLAWTNELHGLLWREVRLSTTPDFVGLALTYGPWFTVQVVYGYGLIAAGTLILAYELAGSPHHRRALAGVVLAPAVVAALNLLHLTGRGPSFIDLTPLGFAISTVVLYATLLRARSLEISPHLHREVLQKLADPVVIFAGDGRVIELNEAAEKMLGESSRAWLQSAFDTPEPCRDAVINGRSYDVRRTRLGGNNGAAAPMTAMVFRDVTERLRTEAELRRMKQEMEHLAHTDPLTELPNRRYFMSRLQEEAARLSGSGSTLSVVLVDLDYFKQVNDTYGHEAGDEVLVQVGRLIRDSIRRGDVAARLGGEEFAVLLPETAPAQARAIAERIRAAIESYAGEHCGQPVEITASAGLATIEAGDGFDLLKLADEALYRAKALGRNAVCG